MPKLSDDELQAILNATEPDARVDNAPRTAVKAAPRSARKAADREALAAKLARLRSSEGLDEIAEPPADLDRDDSQLFTFVTDGPDGTPRRRAAVASAETREVVAEQG
jgi:hypothetical protein